MTLRFKTSLAKRLPPWIVVDTDYLTPSELDSVLILLEQALSARGETGSE